MTETQKFLIYLVINLLVLFLAYWRINFDSKRSAAELKRDAEKAANVLRLENEKYAREQEVKLAHWTGKVDTELKNVCEEVRWIKNRILNGGGKA